jgi:hypothetical protein
MDEQRILEEMERMLAADDPRLAARLAAFGQPGFGQVLRTRRARATLSVMLLILIAAVAAVIYVMSQFGAGQGPRPQQASPPTSQLTTPRASASHGSASAGSADGASTRRGGYSTMTQKCNAATVCDAHWIQVNAKGNAASAQQQSAQQ